MDIRQLVKRFQRNRRLRTLLYGVAMVISLVQLYYSIYGISQSHWNLTKAILNTKEPVDGKSSFEIFKQDTSQIKRLPVGSSIREQLHFQFPYNEAEPIPKMIWQTWKVPRDSKDFKKSFQKYTQEWEEKNPDYVYNMIPDAAAHELIAHLYQTVPKVLHAYNILPKPILKADFFRYLILFARGGIYSDIDTVSLKPAATWVSNNVTLYDEPNRAGLVVGIEADPDRPDWHDYYAKRVQFCQWTIQAKKGHPMLGELIAKITEITLDKESRGLLNTVVGKDAGGDIMDWTGPGIFTDEVFSYFNEVMKHSSSTSKPRIVNKTKQNKYNLDLDIYSGEVDWKFFTLMEEPVVFDDVLILPITGFSPGVGHMGSKSPNHRSAYVRHMFEGSWKPELERNVGDNDGQSKSSKNRPGAIAQGKVKRGSVVVL